MRRTPVFWWSLLAGDFTFHRLTASWFARKQAPTSRQMSLILEANGNELGQGLQSATTPPQRKNSRFIAATPQVSRRSRNATPTSRTPFPPFASLRRIRGQLLSGSRPPPFVYFVVKKFPYTVCSVYSVGHSSVSPFRHSRADSSAPIPRHPHLTSPFPFPRLERVDSPASIARAIARKLDLDASNLT